MRWPLLEPVRTRLADEQGALRKQAATRIALCYPSPYHVGMSSLGFQTIYREIHAHDDAAAERAFLPDDLQAWREARVPLCTYESQQPVAGFSCLAFSVSYELEIAGLFDMLDLAGIPILREERDERHPLIVCGGPLTFSNPVPLAPFADVIVLGEAEELIHTLCDALTLPRHELRTQLSRRPGFYVPELSGSWPGVVKAEDDRLPARSQILTPHTELRSMFLIEPERGCSRGCTYCVMRRTTNGGMRTVDPERVLDLVPEGARRVGLVGAAVTDHPRVVELVRKLVDDGREVGISSLRADRLCARPELVALLAQSGARTLTTAADGASERLRKALDRRTTADQLLHVAGLARQGGFQRLKLYLMVGLPGEEDRDLEELAELAAEISRLVPLSFGCAPFVAKRNTPMDGAPFVPIDEVERRVAYLRARLRGRAEVRPTSPRWAWVEYMLAQGAEDAGLAALEAWRAGGTFAAWKRAFRDRGVRPSRGRRVQDGRLRLPSLAAWPTI
ncbi:MAG: radical SAM protein [Deltaproteobacteria bacterium 13_1_40CM_4_68_19]|nr:MAG: radical SAM protein [Deltaproteobacteria bacterium 13_1_40CM_4_68_19]HMC33809.1 radical SAM protein [Myxococcales bacterium]